MMLSFQKICSLVFPLAACSLILASAEVPSSESTEKKTPPNVIFILVDDMGWGDLDAHWKQRKMNGRSVSRSNEFRTPALSNMAEEGIQLRRHYSAAPVCAPARASLLLGVHQGHARVVRNNRFDQPIENSHTLGSVMKTAGYDTAAIGKWGVGGGGESRVPMTAGPHQRGFDYFYGILDHLSGHYHYPSESRDIFEFNAHSSAPEWKNVKDSVPQTSYSTDLFTARAKKWIVDQQKEAQQTGKPFFLYLAYPAPHGSLAVPSVPYPAEGGLNGGLQWEERDGMASANTAFDSRAISGKDSYIHPDHVHFSKDVAKRHATMIRRVDDSLADIRHLLKDLKIDRNTLIIFTSDNGPHDEPGSDPLHNHGAQDPQFFKSYGMMDGIKRDCWEGGMRVPTLAYWPQGIPKGQVSLVPSQFHDWLATLADIAGVPIPARSDGVSLLPTLSGHPENQKEGTVYAEYFFPGKTPDFSDFRDEHKGAQRGQQQIIYVDGLKGIRMDAKSADKDFMIFDTKSDPQESHDLASDNPELQTRMKQSALRHRRATPVAKTVFDTALVPAVRVSNVAPGLNRSLFEGVYPWVPNFEKMNNVPLKKDVVTAMQVDGDGPENRGVLLTGYLRIPKSGAYRFFLTTDDGSSSRAFVRLHDMELLDADKAYTPGTEVSSDLGEESNPVYLEEGLHPISLSYKGQKGKLSSVSVEWEGPDLQKQAIPEYAFFRDVSETTQVDRNK